MTQKWKTDPKLYNCNRDNQNRKKIDYNLFVKKFMGEDPKRDWESIKDCIKLWEFSKTFISMPIKSILDAGTKDGQMPDYLNNEGYDCIGIEIDKTYVEYAKLKERNVIYGDICNMDFEDDSFDIIFSHHVLGLCPDYTKAYQEMLRVVKPNGFVITLNQVPGNPKKHMCMINSDDEIKKILSNCLEHDIIYFEHKDNNKQLTIILRKK